MNTCTYRYLRGSTEEIIDELSAAVSRVSGYTRHFARDPRVLKGC